MDYYDFLPTFIKQYKNIENVKSVFHTLKDEKEAEIKMCEGFAIRKLACDLYPSRADEIKDICTKIRVELKLERSKI
tara:strand:+ start:93 stop:323 length:231 start_codon:yes stop_codon:yes gene_type:complete